ncbi:MAG: hypothetical protein IJE08_13135 [Clostridia bacterium]|nr:hypothetical protein [Clostridia bacterium]
MTPEKYEKILEGWSSEERKAAEAAKRAGDERRHSICLMKASMMGDMLKVLGKVEMSGRRGTLERLAAQCEAEAEKLRAREDFDAAERSMIKAETIRRARKLIDGEEA